MDPLTGLPTKGEFEEILGSALNGEAGQAPVSVALFDIDHFMQLNERNGHQAGDEAILSIVKLFAAEFPGQAAAMCRIGGDEFAVILRATEKEEAFLRLEQARRGVPEIASLSSIDPRPTISIGVATYPDDGSTRQELMRKADDALFRAKSGGRNRVALAREEKKVPKTSHYTQGQLERLAALATREGVGEAEILREALDNLLKKYSS
jgi:diguanylate cyclase (GGDEF)-like protein